MKIKPARKFQSEIAIIHRPSSSMNGPIVEAWQYKNSVFINFFGLPATKILTRAEANKLASWILKGPK